MKSDMSIHAIDVFCSTGLARPCAAEKSDTIKLRSGNCYDMENAFRVRTCDDLDDFGRSAGAGPKLSGHSDPAGERSIYIPRGISDAVGKDRDAGHGKARSKPLPAARLIRTGPRAS